VTTLAIVTTRVWSAASEIEAFAYDDVSMRIPHNLRASTPVQL
jgi:hypothetical protein